MAGSVNKVILLGRLGGDPEVRVSQDGSKIARFSIATGETWKDKSTNEKKERTDWHKIVIFSPGLSEIVEKYLKKGSQVYLEGQIRTRKYTDQAGVEKSTTEVVLQGYNCHLTMLDGRSDEVQTVSSPNIENSKIDKKVDQGIEEFDIEDEVPF
ncbi:MAG: single-stranded DNA-binding protein [Alphaproteobacteria bacterium]|tara:strand:+ start:797 stop:1258 length:462 start_codon:yes stop_codon:yes gene_type:complete